MNTQQRIKELTSEEWFQELERGRVFRRKYGLEDSWASNEAMFYNVHETNENAGPNLIMSIGDAMMSALSIPVPQVLLGARRKELVGAARILESLDNGLIQDLELQDEIDTAILHAFLWGRGILKIGYDSEWGWNPRFDYGKKKNPLGLSLTQFDKEGRRIEFADVKPGMPWVRSVLPHDILVPYGTKDLRSTEWIAHRVIRHVDDIRADVKYSRTGKLQPVMSMEDFIKSYTTKPKAWRAEGGAAIKTGGEGRAEYCELYEIHDRRSGKVMVISTGHKGFLRNEEDLMQDDGLPFEEVGFVPGARAFWVTPDAYYLRISQAELADVSLQATKQRRLSVLRFMSEETAIDEKELDRALSADVGVCFKVKDSRGKDALVPITPYTNNQLLYLDASYIRQNAREITGMSRNQLGEYDPKSRISATETMTVQSGSSQRMGRRGRLLGKVYERIIKKVNRIIFKQWTTPRWIEVIGEEGTREWIQYQGSELMGDYKYEVFFSPINVPSLTARQQRALQLYTSLGRMKDPKVMDEFLAHAYNDPELAEVFQSADLHLQMPGMQGGAGVVPSNIGTE